jgi:thiamine transporter ThiT
MLFYLLHVIQTILAITQAFYTIGIKECFHDGKDAET